MEAAPFNDSAAERQHNGTSERPGGGEDACGEGSEGEAVPFSVMRFN
jgi:hypothetical protein